jgi:hypothetical protein
MILDLSHQLAPGMPAYPGLPVPKFHVFLAHGDARVGGIDRVGAAALGCPVEQSSTRFFGVTHPLSAMPPEAIAQTLRAPPCPLWLKFFPPTEETLLFHPHLIRHDPTPP